VRRREEERREESTAGDLSSCLSPFKTFTTSPPVTLSSLSVSQQHPGFDFSGAAFSGAAPDPRTFLREDE